MTDKEQPDTPPRPGRGRGLRIALFLSLAFNLLIVGFVAGAVLRKDGGIERRGPALGQDAGIGPFAQALSPEQRREFAREIARRSGDFRRNRQKLAGSLQEMMRVLRSDEFDAARLAAVLDATRSDLNERQRIGVEVLVSQLAAMSPAERAEFADRLERSLRRASRH